MFSQCDLLDVVDVLHSSAENEHAWPVFAASCVDADGAVQRVAPPTCQLPDGPRGLVAEQRRGGQRARHALHQAEMLQALGHVEQQGGVGLRGSVAA